MIIQFRESVTAIVFGGGIYVDIDSWPVIGGSMTLGNVLFDNQADNGNQLYRDYESDTITWTPHMLIITILIFVLLVLMRCIHQVVGI